MRFLIVNALSPAISTKLNEIGYDSIHVKEIGLRDAEDEAIFKRALKEKKSPFEGGKNLASLFERDSGGCLQGKGHD